MMRKKEELVNKISEQYKEAAIQHRDALIEGDHKTANKQYARLKKLFDKFKQSKFLIDEVLTPLLSSEDVRVRTWAASHSLGLKINIEDAENVLKKASCMKDIGILRFTAEMTLKVWRDQGYLKF